MFTESNSRSLDYARDRHKTSKYKGVHWRKRTRKWAAAIRCSNKTYHLGYFDNEIDAAGAYDRRAKKYDRRFAALNFPDIATDAVLSRGEGGHRDRRVTRISESEDWSIEHKKTVWDIAALEPAGSQFERAPDQRHGSRGTHSIWCLGRGRLEPLAHADRDAEIGSPVVQTELQ
jgi:hypothetical protein